MRVGCCRRRPPPAALLAASALLLVCAAPRGARACALLTYTFQPDCFRASGAAGCAFDAGHPDFGPQIAVWVESADGTRFVDTLMVTSAVAVHGIGNRPGTWNMRSGPRFPYGRRQMALPIWAHARGHLYGLVVMEDMNDDWMTTHEDNSSPETYFCRPMQPFEIVDAITCPSGRFRSCKGRFDSSMPQSYYPPRADLFDFGQAPCPMLPNYLGSCDPGDSAQYAFLNDVDTVATATPPFGAPFSSTWVVPDDLPDGDYALYVEVAKEFDADAANQHPSYINPIEANAFNNYGQEGNVGAPSVLFRVPFSLGAGAPAGASAMEIAGYGDWTGATGDVHTPDGTFGSGSGSGSGSGGDPGSGAGRLAVIDGPTGPGRVHVARAACGAVDCASAPPPTSVAFVTDTISARSATLRIHQSNDGGRQVLGYELRTTVLPTPRAVIDPTTFPDWTPAGTVAPGPPDGETTASIDGLAPDTDYAVGMSARGQCSTSPPTFQRFHTPAVKFAQLSGCFIATAAFGSDLAPEVEALRRARDAATAASPIARAAVDLYYRSSPPLAALIARSETARALVRTALRAALPGGARAAP
jgi:hypothetical protein